MKKAARNLVDEDWNWNVRFSGKRRWERWAIPPCVFHFLSREHLALCSVSLNSQARVLSGEKEQGPLERFMLRDKTLFKSLRDGPCRLLSSLPLPPRDDTPVVRGSRLLGFTRCIILARGEIPKTAEENLLYSHNSPRCHWNFMRWRTGVLLTLST